MKASFFQELQNDGLQKAVYPGGHAFGNGFSIPKFVRAVAPAKLFLKLVQS
jgi:hypothetical protein